MTKIEMYRKLIVDIYETRRQYMDNNSTSPVYSLCYSVCSILNKWDNTSPVIARPFVKPLEVYRTTEVHKLFYWPKEDWRIRIKVLEFEIKRLETPWWKRWLIKKQLPQ